MKLQIDTAAKTIKLEQSTKIVDFISSVKKLLPNDWKDYSIECVTVINNWYNPITVPYWGQINPLWQLPSTICDTGTINLDLSGMDKTVCNVEITNN